MKIEILQEINPQTGTRLDCPWPWTDKYPHEDGYCLQQRQQRSPRFLPRHRSDDLGSISKNNLSINPDTHTSKQRRQIKWFLSYHKEDACLCVATSENDELSRRPRGSFGVSCNMLMSV